MHYAEFAEDESQALLSAIKDYENNKWKTIGQKVGKPAKVSGDTEYTSCLRWEADQTLRTGLRAVRQRAFPGVVHKQQGALEKPTKSQISLVVVDSFCQPEDLSSAL